MTFDPEKHHRRSIRLPGLYFVTICAADRRHRFGRVNDGVMRLNDIGRIAEEEWPRTAALRPYVALDAYVIMPDHMHGVIGIPRTIPPHPRRRCELSALRWRIPFRRSLRPTRRR